MWEQRVPPTIVTVDYEVFGNGTGDVRPCVIAAAHRIAGLAEQRGIRIVFFVEVLELMARSRRGDRGEEQVAAVVAQLAHLRDRGHELALHLHPQWLAAGLGEEAPHRWVPEEWRFGALDRARQRQAVTAGLAWFRSHDLGRPVAFRAGGWCIQPLGRALDLLAECGIRFECSVAPGMVERAPLRRYDFRDFSDPAMTSGGCREVPIATGRCGVVGRLVRELGARLAGPPRAPGCVGSYTDGGTGVTRNAAALLEKLARAGWAMADFCKLPAPDLIRMRRRWTEAWGLPFVMIGHTKTFDRRAQMQLDRFLESSSAAPFARYEDLTG